MNTSAELAGQKAWHIGIGEAAPRISGKYFQLRTQKPSPELATTGRAGLNGDAEAAVLHNKDFAQAGLHQQRSLWRCKALIHQSRYDLLPRFQVPARPRVKAA